MREMKKLPGITTLITDADNTIYNWVQYIVPCLEAMVDYLQRKTGFTPDQISESFKKVFEKYLPKEIIYRKKMGFTVPTKRWFAGDLLEPARDIVFSKRLMDTGWFQRKYLETTFDRHSAGKEDYSRRIFSLLVLYHWLGIYS